MAALVHEVTTTIEDLKTELSLTDGTTYNIQNTGDNPVFFREDATAPAADLDIQHWNYLPARSRKIVASAGDYTPKAGEGMYVRTNGGSSVLVVNEAP